MSENERSTSSQGETPRRAILVAQNVALNAFLFAALGIYLAITTGGAWQAVQFIILSTQVIVTGFVSAALIRRGRSKLGAWLLFASDLIAPIWASLLVSDLGYVAMTYILVTTYFIISYMIPREARRVTIGLTVLGLVISFLAEVIDPAWRLVSPLMLTVAPILTGLLGAIFIAVVARQAWTGSMRNKLLVAFIAVTAVATGALGVYMFITTSNNLQDNLERELSEVATSRAVRVGDLFNEQINQLTTLTLDDDLQEVVEEQNQSYEGDAATIQAVLDARDVQWRTADEANNNRDFLVQANLTNTVALDLTEYQEAFPANVEVFVTDVYGGMAGSTNRTSDYFQADEGWWQAAYNNGEGAVYIGEPEFDESAGEAGVNIALPLRNRETGEIIGILRTTYLVSALKTILADTVGETGSTDLFVPGEIVSHVHEGGLEEAVPGLFEQLQEVYGQGMVELVYEDELSVVTQAPVQTLEGNPAVDNLGWVVAFHQHRDEAFAPVAAATQGFIIVLLIVVALAVAAAYFVAQLLSNPIVRLTAVAEDIAGGNIDARAEATTSDEVGTLATAFNTMTAQLREFIGTLEQRVADRTKAIATSSEVSRRLSTILNRDALVKEVVEQLVTAFDYYYAHIYLFNENKDTLVMMGGTGEAGQTMLARGHTIPKGDGMVGRAGASNQVVLAPDTSKEDGWLPNELLPETRSELAVPISIGDEVLGVFDVQHSVVNGLTEEDADLMNSIANQVAVALQNIESAETVAKRAKELETVAAISTATATIQNTHDMLATVVQLTQRRFGLYHAHVFIYNEDIKELQIEACGYQEGDEHEGTHGTASIPIAQEQSLVARAARTRQPVIVNDVRGEPGWLPNPLLPDTRAELAVPLIVGNSVLGVLDVQSDRINAFTEDDANIQTTLASQVATALQNAQSYTEAQQQAERETKLGQITQKIQGAETIEEAMQVAARELGHALGKRQTFVALDPAALVGDGKKAVTE